MVEGLVDEQVLHRVALALVLHGFTALDQLHGARVHELNAIVHT